MKSQLTTFAKNNAALLLVALSIYSIGIRMEPMTKQANLENRCIKEQMDYFQNEYWSTVKADWDDVYRKAADACRF